MKIKIDDEILEDITDEKENIYQKLARATARAVDINLGKTTLADLLDGYTKSITLQERIDQAIEYIKKFDFNYLDETYEHNLREHLENILEILGDKE